MEQELTEAFENFKKEIIENFDLRFNEIDNKLELLQRNIAGVNYQLMN